MPLRIPIRKVRKEALTRGKEGAIALMILASLLVLYLCLYSTEQVRNVANIRH